MVLKKINNFRHVPNVHQSTMSEIPVIFDPEKISQGYTEDISDGLNVYGTSSIMRACC